MDNFASLCSSLSSRLGGLESLDQLSPPERIQLASQLESLRRQVEPPMLFWQGLIQAPQHLTTARLAIAMGIFAAFADKKNAPMTLQDLAPMTRGDTELLDRIMRGLYVCGIMQQPKPSYWQPTALGTQLIPGAPPTAMVKHFYNYMRSYSSLLEFFIGTSFANPNDAFNGPWQFAYKTDKHYFSWLVEKPARQEAASTVMTIQQQYRGQDWFEFFPVEERLGGGSPNRVLLVDIGGGVGHDAAAFRNKFPSLQGRIIVQDLPEVLAVRRNELPPAVEAQAHDMFKTQPVQGARVYYLRTVLHDWPDAQAIQVLQQVKVAMQGSNDSMLLVNENVVEEEKPQAVTVGVDFLMMNAMAALERSEVQWRKVLDEAGFRVVKVWKAKGQVTGNTALFEATLK